MNYKRLFILYSGSSFKIKIFNRNFSKLLEHTKTTWVVGMGHVMIMYCSQNACFMQKTDSLYTD